MSPLILIAINDAHRRDLMRAAHVERFAEEARQSYMLKHGREPLRPSIVVLATYLRQAQHAFTREEQAVVCGCEVS